MRLLVLGGTVFLSRAVATEAVARGHEVTCACRGASGDVPAGARHLAWDRADGAAPPAALDGSAYDAVVDVARHPSWVRTAVAAVPDAHWVFVSTINVYADDATPQGRPGGLPLRDPQPDDVDLGVDPEAYGAMKVACEQLVTEGAASAMVVRPGLIVGPGDPTRPLHLLAGPAGRHRRAPGGAAARRAGRLGAGDRRARPRRLDRGQRRAAAHRHLRRHRAGA